ncbi:MULTISPECIES: bifunctional hydroxymethylpyrimidine kinase/phosphomethylpyrimidine kinase [Metallosphaera]|uniref:Phosphomethylpyrimidine kinase n=3 Tax=Metallosphaera TaxID=41980 RepID=A4YEG9_METS5|nr:MULTISPECIES: bifunctional hydroxymethylpyrimidine kinase/phosphomethylpyrimidine kinase [Metallosphaera]ABP94821.1 phosphomethylpyrimidine kinase [Metallosphaera sedula DSM 5348]AIM26808.1 phosphomethylpyrimidine kinase [Metallosphaera sedula]AKV73759.1 phosphomethylpyrimidine kinase [Metallosphaera sedula]AKV75999.1 phosphomethylpyrimidine kinase [Metallosphaera sedula]AKV78250.1 phosphomethylpyrimidine kinase [Metallosphaera sedula]
MKKPVVMAIGGFDSGGGAGVESDIKVLESIGVHGVGAITAVTAQNTLGIKHVTVVDHNSLRKQIETLLEDFKVSSGKTGMIVNGEQMKVVFEAVNFPLVVDPVIYAKDGTKLIEDLEAFKKFLLPRATVITPNAVEAGILLGMKVETLQDQITASKLIHERFSVPYVVVKGGHVKSSESVDVLYDGKEVIQLSSPRLPGRNTHGTGSIFASSIAGMLAKGFPMKEAVRRAKSITEESIRYGLEIGRGIGPADPMVPLEKIAMKAGVMKDMEIFAEFVEREKNFYLLVPEVQSNLAHSIDPKYVTGIEDIATFRGRIIREWGGRVRVGFPVAFGYPTHTARLLLSIINKQGVGDTLINIRYDPKIVELLKRIGYEVVEVHRELEPQGQEGKTMSWIVDHVYESLGKIPNVIFDRGMIGKEAMIRLWTSSIEEMMESLTSLLREIGK